MNEKPRIELLDEAGRVLATAALTDEVLTETDTHGVVKEIPMGLDVTESGKATHYRTINSNGDVAIGAVIQIDPSANTVFPLYLMRVDLKAGERLAGCFRTTTIKEGQSQ